MQYTQTPTDDLIPYASNSRTHSDEQIMQIASSIKEFGFLNPVLIDKDHGIIAGHGRVMAARKLGLESVPTLLVDHLTEAQRKAYVIADNQLALNAGWDFDLLKVEIEGLQEIDFDVGLLGFDDSFVDNLFKEEDFSDKNQEIDSDNFDDEMEMKFKFSSDQYAAVNEKLQELGDSKEIALLSALGL